MQQVDLPRPLLALDLGACPVLFISPSSPITDWNPVLTLSFPPALSLPPHFPCNYRPWSLLIWLDAGAQLPLRLNCSPFITTILASETCPWPDTFSRHFRLSTRILLPRHPLDHRDFLIERLRLDLLSSPLSHSRVRLLLSSLSATSRTNNTSSYRSSTSASSSSPSRAASSAPSISRHLVTRSRPTSSRARPTPSRPASSSSTSCSQLGRARYVYFSLLSASLLDLDFEPCTDPLFASSAFPSSPFSPNYFPSSLPIRVHAAAHFAL